MTTRKYDTGEAGIKAAVDAVKKGGTVVYPTETCYGIGGNALRRKVIDHVYEVKQRPREKKLTVIVADLEMAEQFAYLSADERHLCEAFMPGPLTLVARKKPGVPNALNDRFVFRIPGSKTAREITRQAEMPIIATSANISGQPANYRVEDIDEDILYNVNVVLDGGELERRPSSTIVAVDNHHAKIIREGPVSQDAIHDVLNE